MIEDDAKYLALHRVSGRDVDGLVKAPDHEGDGERGVDAYCEFLHGESCCNAISVLG